MLDESQELGIVVRDEHARRKYFAHGDARSPLKPSLDHARYATAPGAARWIVWAGLYSDRPQSVLEIGPRGGSWGRSCRVFEYPLTKPITNLWIVLLIVPAPGI